MLDEAVYFFKRNMREKTIIAEEGKYYRNSLFAETMAKFNMIDTVQMGIQEFFSTIPNLTLKPCS